MKPLWSERREKRNNDAFQLFEYHWDFPYLGFRDCERDLRLACALLSALNFSSYFPPLFLLALYFCFPLLFSWECVWRLGPRARWSGLSDLLKDDWVIHWPAGSVKELLFGNWKGTTVCKTKLFFSFLWMPTAVIKVYCDSFWNREEIGN